MNLQAYLIIDDVVKIRINTGSELLLKTSLENSLSVGDYLIKNTGSDTLTIYKAGKGAIDKYIFQIRDDLGYPLKLKGKEK